MLLFYLSYTTTTFGARNKCYPSSLNSISNNIDGSSTTRSSESLLNTTLHLAYISPLLINNIPPAKRKSGAMLAVSIVKTVLSSTLVSAPF